MENLTDKIQDYLDGLLDEVETQRFEQGMREDAELRNFVRLQREVQGIIKQRLESGEEAVRANLEQARVQMTNPPQSNKLIKMYVPLGAAVCLLLIVGLFLFRGTDQSLYDLPIMPSEVVRGEVGPSDYETAVLLFNEGKYKEARAVLEPLILAEPDIVQYQYYAALTFVGSEDWSGASLALQPLAEGVSIYADDAKYYLALAYWKQGNAQDAQTVLGQIPDDGKLAEKKASLLKAMK